MTTPLGERRSPLAHRALGGVIDALRLRQMLSDSYALVVHVANWGTADTGRLSSSSGFEHDATQTAWRKVVAGAKP